MDSRHVSQGTYYGGQGGGGHCSYQMNSAYSVSGTGVAINAAQYAGSATCGLCVAYRGTGTGVGTAPIPTTWQYATGTHILWQSCKWMTGCYHPCY